MRTALYTDQPHNLGLDCSAGAKDILRETKKYSDKAEVQVSRATYATSYLFDRLDKLEHRLSIIEKEFSRYLQRI